MATVNISLTIACFLRFSRLSPLFWLHCYADKLGYHINRTLWSIDPQERFNWHNLSPLRDAPVKMEPCCPSREDQHA